MISLSRASVVGVAVGFLKASEDKKGERERERGIGKLEAIDPLLIYFVVATHGKRRCRSYVAR